MTGRFALSGAIALLILLPACKPRGGGEGSSVKSDESGTEGKLDVADLCRTSGSKKFMEVRSDGAVLYDKKPGRKSENGWENWNHGVATLDKEQNTTPFWHLSVPFGADDEVPFCLVGRSSLSPRELAAGLDCVKDDPCGGSKDLTQVAVFQGNGDLAAADVKGLALADTTGVKCDGAQLLGNKSGKIGVEIPGNLGGSALCERLAKEMSKSSVVCGYNGKGFTPFGIAKGWATGGIQQATNIQLCSDLINTARGSKVCALDERAYRIYDVTAVGTEGRATATDDGSFATLDQCAFFLAETAAAPKGLQLTASGVDALDLDSASIRDFYSTHFYSNPTFGNVAPRTCAGSDGLVFFSSCNVDVVYSWGPMAKIRDLERQIGAGNWNQSAPIKRFDKDKPSPIFTTHSTIASHGYGEAAIRIKLKPGIQYVRGDFNSNCSILTDPSRQVVERYAGRNEWNFIELIICAPGPIQSWSYFTKQHFDELAYETATAWTDLGKISVNLQGTRSWPLYFKVSGRYGLIGVGIDDGTITNYREHMFKSRLVMLARSARAGQARVYVNSDSRNSVTVKSHFPPKVPFSFQLTSHEEDGAVAGQANADVGYGCSAVRGRSFVGAGRKVILSGSCDEYTKEGTYVGATQKKATRMSWTIDASVSPSRIQVEILEGSIKGDVFFYTVRDSRTICFAGQTNYSGPTNSCMAME